MNSSSSTFAPLAGLHTNQPQPDTAAVQIVNFTVDPETSGWSSRLGFEPYTPRRDVGFAPFESMGRIDSLAVLVGSTRHQVYFETGGVLYALYEAGGLNGNALQVEEIRSNRVQPAISEAPSQFIPLGDGSAVVVNGHDRPLLIGAGGVWGLTTEVTPAVTNFSERNIGFIRPPAPPQPFDVQVLDSPSGGPADTPDVTAGESTIFWPTDKTAYGKPGAYGLGLSGESKTSSYRWAVSFVSEDGSESPLSPLSSEVSWSIPSGDGGFRYVVPLRIERGPPGTVARRIYRTANVSIDAPTYGDYSLYFVSEIRNNVESLFYDGYPITSSPAPQIVDSGPFPAPEARFGAVFGGRLWLDGGAREPNRLYYSAPGKIDQWPVDGYIDLDGPGEIRGVVPGARMLLVLRSTGIDAVTYRSDGGWQVGAVTRDVACRSPATVSTPDGLLVIAQDGIWLVAGATDGGGSVQVRNLTLSIGEVWAKVNPAMLARAAASWSPVTREAHFYVAADGHDRPNLGLIWHSDKEAWSTRVGFPVGSLALHPSGHLVFGHNRGADAATQSAPVPPCGLFVISGRRTLGAVIKNDALVDEDPPTSVYQSAWISWGSYVLKKKVLFVDLLVPTTGDWQVTIQTAKDQREVWTDAPTYRLQPPDSDDLPVWDTAVWDTAVWERAGMTAIRYAVAIQSCTTFAWKIETTADVILVGAAIDYTAAGTKILQGKV